jgi:hypothetical protein
LRPFRNDGLRNEDEAESSLPAGAQTIGFLM